MRWHGVWIFGLVVLLGIACEPLAPDIEQQVIVVTSAPTETPIGNLIPASPTVEPTPTITPSPTVFIAPTLTLPPCDQTEGTFFESSYESAIAGGDVAYNIYLPPCFFESGRRFPLVILLHGANSDFEQWADFGIEALLNEGLADGMLSPAVVVMPDGGAQQTAAVFEIGQSYEEMLLDELLPSLERDYCLWDEARAMGGIARGAFWAVSAAFRHPDLFGRVGAHSPTFLPDNAPATHNPLALAERAAGIEALTVRLDNAQNDPDTANVAAFSNSLRARAISHDYLINPGGATGDAYWEANLPDYLAFYTAAWPRSMAELPSCQ